MIKVKIGQVWKRVGDGWISTEGESLIITGRRMGLWQFNGCQGGYAPTRFRGTSEYDSKLNQGSELQFDETGMINLILSRYD